MKKILITLFLLCSILFMCSCGNKNNEKFNIITVFDSEYNEVGSITVDLVGLSNYNNLNDILIDEVFIKDSLLKLDNDKKIESIYDLEKTKVTEFFIYENDESLYGSSQINFNNEKYFANPNNYAEILLDSDSRFIIKLQNIDYNYSGYMVENSNNNIVFNLPYDSDLIVNTQVNYYELEEEKFFFSDVTNNGRIFVYKNLVGSNSST